MILSYFCNRISFDNLISGQQTPWYATIFAQIFFQIKLFHGLLFEPFDVWKFPLADMFNQLVTKYKSDLASNPVSNGLLNTMLILYKENK